MGNLFSKLFSTRSIVGTVFLIILIGEPTVGATTGLFTPGGIIVFFFLYLSLFHLFESIIAKYQLVFYQVILITFILYAVFVTGFLNKEITEYILKPNLFITLIRIQASFFVAFTFYLLNQWFPKNPQKILSIKQSLMFFFIFVLLISTTKVWGIPSLLFTLKTAPGLSLLFVVLSIIASFLSITYQAKPSTEKNTRFNLIIILCCIFGAIPNLLPFIALVITMIVAGIYTFFNKDIKNYKL